jgi:hypothetical protein
MAKSNGALTLDHRIADALATDQLTSETLAALYSELDDAIGIAESTARECRARSVDPLVPDGIAERSKAEDLEFVAQRLRNAAPPLGEKYRKTLAREQRAAWEIETAPIEKQLAEVAVEFQARYPELVAEMVSLFQRVELADQAAVRASSGVGSLSTIDTRVRGVKVVMRDTVLPTLGGGRNAWPVRNFAIEYTSMIEAMVKPEPTDDGYNEFAFDESLGCYAWRRKAGAPPLPPSDTRSYEQRVADDEARKQLETMQLRAYYDDIAAAKVRNDVAAAEAEMERRRIASGQGG